VTAAAGGSDDRVGAASTPWLLAIDTGTSNIVVAAGAPDGSLIKVLEWPAGYRHGEQLLAGVEQLLAETGLSRDRLVGVVVGTGPGAFTGLRVGLATAKTLAHALGLPIAGVGTGEALLEADVEATALLLPAGPRDRVLVRRGAPPELLAGGAEPVLPGGVELVAVDLDGRAPESAVRRGAAAARGLGPALLAMGAARLRAGTGDDVETLVPEYVTLPRGVRASSGEISWSHDPR
jgi:tRNA threonylcarbamoyladenosine biosynthesis protein TsaB